jgi:hypothetical protein
MLCGHYERFSFQNKGYVQEKPTILKEFCHIIIINKKILIERMPSEILAGLGSRS